MNAHQSENGYTRASLTKALLTGVVLGAGALVLTNDELKDKLRNKMKHSYDELKAKGEDLNEQAREKTLRVKDTLQSV